MKQQYPPGTDTSTFVVSYALLRVPGAIAKKHITSHPSRADKTYEKNVSTPVMVKISVVSAVDTAARIILSLTASGSTSLRF